MPQVHHATRAGVLLVLVLAAVGAPATAQQPQPPSTPLQAPPAPAVPPAQDPAAVAPAPVAVPVAPPVPGTVTCPVPVPPATVPARSFTAPAGMLFHQVIPARIKDFELFIAYVRDALEKSTNETVRNQAKGWEIYRSVEAGPNGDALYVFVLNPAVPCVDYALAPILAEAYPDPAQLQEIWKLYQSSVRPSGSTLLTLVPAPKVAPTPLLTPPTTPAAGAKPLPGAATGAQPPATSPGATTAPPATQKPAPR